MKNIVIIGCGQGIGLETAKLLAENNNVIGISRTKTEAVENLGIPFYELDILEDSLEIVDFPEQIHGLVYAPGTINLKPFNRLSDKDFLLDFNINVLGAVKIIQQLLPQLKKSGGASVVLFSTVAAKLGMPFHSSVSASKSAVEGLVKSLAAEYAVQNIRFNAVAPSLTDTSLAGTLLSTPEKIQAANNRHPLHRIGQPDEIASLVSFLLSETSSWMTGQIIGIDGGLGSVKI